MKRKRARHENLKYCPVCQRLMPLSYQDRLCPACMDRELFHEVRDYIRSNTVNEFQVADHFNISIMRVKEWIKEGRIQYKEDPNSKLYVALHCQVCGDSVCFGNLCSKCMQNKLRAGHAAASPHLAKGDMRFLHKEKD